MGERWKAAPPRRRETVTDTSETLDLFLNKNFPFLSHPLFKGMVFLVFRHSDSAYFKVYLLQRMQERSLFFLFFILVGILLQFETSVISLLIEYLR